MRVLLTPNQIVAYNLAQARAVAGLDAGGGGRAPRAVPRHAMVEGELLRRRAIGRRRAGTQVQRRRDRGVRTRLRAPGRLLLPATTARAPPTRTDPPRRTGEPRGGSRIARADRRRVRARPARSATWGCASRSSSARSPSSCRPRRSDASAMHTEVVVEAIVKRDLDRFSAWRTMLTNLAQPARGLAAGVPAKTATERGGGR